MIPKIIHSRSQLLCHLNEYEDGARTLFVLADTYPELFDFHCPKITQLAPKGWRVSKSEKMKYLWFPSGSLGTADLTRIEEWKQHFEQYVLIGLSRNIAPGFNQELDFCMGLSFNYDPNAKTRTPFGEALYQAKYQSSKNHFAELTGVMSTAVALLPIPPEEKSNLLVTSVPSDPGSDNFGRKLAAAVAAAWQIPFAASGLLCNKNELKNLPFMEKVKQWCDLYESGPVRGEERLQERPSQRRKRTRVRGDRCPAEASVGQFRRISGSQIPLQKQLPRRSPEKGYSLLTVHRVC